MATDRRLVYLTALIALAASAGANTTPRTMAQVLEASDPTDWTRLDPENTLYLELASGRVILALAPSFAPQHATNVKKLARAGYFDGLSINRSQDNYVVQWGDPESDVPDKRRPLRNARESLTAEFDRAADAGFRFTQLPDGDVYAPEVGFSDGFPAARDVKAGRAWLAHCYGMVGAGRGDGPESSGAELYVVIGHGPRHLDRNVTLLGRVVQGMELLSVLPRGTGPMGFHERPDQRVPIRSVRVAADLPEASRSDLELLRTDTATFTALVESRRNRREPWFRTPAGRIDLCNVPLPVRARVIAASR